MRAILPRHGPSPEHGSKGARARRQPAADELADLDARAAELRELIRVLPRFSPEAVRKHRHSLAITAAQYASLLGVSMRMVYNWEEGHTRPKPDHLLRWIDLAGTEDEAALKPLGLVAVRTVSPRQLRSERRRLGLRQAQLRALLGTEQSVISSCGDVETGKRTPTRESLRKIETAHELTRDEAACRIGWNSRSGLGRSVKVRANWSDLAPPENPGAVTADDRCGRSRGSSWRGTTSRQSFEARGGDPHRAGERQGAGAPGAAQAGGVLRGQEGDVPSAP